MQPRIKSNKRENDSWITDRGKIRVAFGQRPAGTCGTASLHHDCAPTTVSYIRKGMAECFILGQNAAHAQLLSCLDSAPALSLSTRVKFDESNHTVTSKADLSIAQGLSQGLYDPSVRPQTVYLL